jgi:hypothetical protein
MFLVFAAVVEAAGNEANISDITLYISRSQVEINITQTNVTDLTAGLVNTSNATVCAYKYECKPTGEGSYWFNCYVDKADVCRCYKGKLLNCNVTRSSLTMDEWCKLQYECKQRRDGKYWFKCYYDRKDEKCRCYVTSYLCAENITVNETISNVSESVTDYESAQQQGFFADATKKIGSAVKLAYRNRVVRIAVPAAVIIALLTVYLFNRDSPANNLRKARKYHKLGERHHNKGQEDKAKRYYELAQIFREKAVK